jgi:hypothetical protein
MRTALQTCAPRCRHERPHHALIGHRRAIAAYALDALDAREIPDFEQHLASCPDAASSWSNWSAS